MLARLVEVAAKAMSLSAEIEAAGRVDRIADCEPILMPVNDVQLAEPNRPLAVNELDLVIVQREDVFPIEFVDAEQLWGFVPQIPVPSLLVVAELVDQPHAREPLAEPAKEEFNLPNLFRKVAEPRVSLEKRLSVMVRDVAV